MSDKTRILKNIILYTGFFVAILIFGRCANVGSLTGGLKDEEPPEVVESSPENYSIHFDKKRIEITFDEFIVLNNVNQELVVSPPLKEKPEVRLKNKSILIDLNNELRDSTTYTLNFGEAIQDNNEGNPLSNFEFVFSTGNYLDSLSVGGSLLNAFDRKVIEESVGVMLYDKLDDSVVYREIPVYIAKTDKKGNFRINNLKTGTYKIFALNDLNNNFLFDLPNESIAFADSFLNVDPDFFLEIIKAEKERQRLDSIARDSAVEISVKTEEPPAPQKAENKKGRNRPPRGERPEMQIDTLAVDSVTDEHLPLIPDQLLIDLVLFTEENQSQFLNNNERKEKNKIEFSFNLPVSDSFAVKSLIPDRKNWYLKEETPERDSFVYWIIDNEVSEMDSILLELDYVVLDSMDKRVWSSDSLYFVYREPAKSSRKRNVEEEKPDNMLLLSGPGRNAVVELNEKLRLTSETPVNYIDTSLVKFRRLEDSIYFREPYNIYKDSVHSRIIHFDKEWKAEQVFELVFYPGAVMDVFGKTNDTLNFNFSVRNEDYYGTLIVNMDSLQGPMIIQLLDTKEKVLREHFMDEPGLYSFEYLKAGDYKLKFIHDANGNRKWDTGKYIEKRQPEKVEYYSGKINIRANWDMEVKFR